MDIVETDPECKTIQSNIYTGPLPSNQNGVYREVQYINYSNENVYLKDNAHKIQDVKPMGVISSVPYIEVRTRFVVGKRVDKQGIDVSKADHIVTTIYIETLRKKPLYISSTDVVIMLADHIHSAEHPHSEEHVQKTRDMIYHDAIKSAQSAPFAIVANDPTGDIKQLYLSINGYICSINVTSYTDKSIGDKITLYYRDVLTSQNMQHRTVRTSFTELKKQDFNLWEIDRCILSPSYETLQYHLNHQHIKKEDHIPITEAERRIKAVEDKYKYLDDEKTDTIKAQKDKVKKLDAYIKELESLGYSAENAQHQYDKLRAEKEALNYKRQHDREQYERERLRRQHDIRQMSQKMQEREWDAIVAAIKGVGVVVPIGFSLYKLIGAK